MHDNYFVRRILLIVAASMLVYSFVTFGASNFLAPEVFAHAKQQEMMPRVEFAARRATEVYQIENVWFPEKPYFMTGADMSQWGGAVHVFDRNGDIVYTNAETLCAHSENEPQLKQIIHLMLNGRVDAGFTCDTLGFGLRKGRGWKSGEVLVGLPIVQGSHIVGAVVMISSIDEMMDAVAMLIRVLLVTSISILFLLLPIAVYSSKRIIRPMETMRDAALKMANGDFTVTADVRESGMMGELAGTLNYLSSELNKTVSALTVERNRALSIINVLDEGILLLDQEGNVLHENAGFRSILAGCCNRCATLPDEAWNVVRTALDSRKNAEYFFRHDGMQIRLNVLTIDSGRSGAVVVLRDETRAFRLEQTRREYVANVSHELRTPLTAIRALAEPLCDGMVRDEEKRQELYATILRETLRLSRLVDDMLQISRLQSGTVDIEKTAFPLEPLLQNVTEVFGVRADDCDHTLRLLLPDEPMPLVYSNADRIEQVLITLLDNAIRHTPCGTDIFIRIQLGLRGIRVIVEDNGNGVMPEDLPHVFDRFYKADKSHSGAGNGLGLSIAHEIITRMEEHIGVFNRPEGGACFWFTLRRADSVQTLCQP